MTRSKWSDLKAATMTPERIAHAQAETERLIAVSKTADQLCAILASLGVTVEADRGSGLAGQLTLDWYFDDGSATAEVHEPGSVIFSILKGPHAMRGTAHLTLNTVSVPPLKREKR